MKKNPPFYALIKSGPHKGKRQYPHLHPDGRYVATTSKFKADYVRVADEEELSALVRAGYGARLSNLSIENAPSYITKSSLIFDEVAEPSLDVIDFLKSFAERDTLDHPAVSNYRVEQIFLRTFLLGGCQVGCCGLCGKSLPKELLVAAHIKPRNKCSKAERLDFNNVAMLMCSLGCDSLFEYGFVYGVEGRILRNPRREISANLEDTVSFLEGRSIDKWHGSSRYFQWHAKEFGWRDTNYPVATHI